MGSLTDLLFELSSEERMAILRRLTKEAPCRGPVEYEEDGFKYTCFETGA